MKTDGNEAITQNYQFFIIYLRGRNKKKTKCSETREIRISATFVISVRLQRAVACVFV